MKSFKLKKKLTVDSLADWQKVASFLKTEIFNQTANAVLFLSGEVGAGKTTLIRNLAKELGFKVDAVASPTFAIHHRYQNNELTLDHLDLYRLESEDEIESVGLWDLFDADENSYIAIEWSERLSENHIPHHWPLFKINILYEKDSQTRTVEVWHLLSSW